MRKCDLIHFNVAWTKLVSWFLQEISHQLGSFSLGETKLIFWSTWKTAKNIGLVSRQNENNIIWFLGSVFMLPGFGYSYKSVMFYSLFFFQKAENDRLKKPTGQIFVIFFVLFLLLKIGLVGSIDLTWFRLAKVSIVIINLINACSTNKLQLDCKFLWPQVDLNCRPLACNAGI